MVNGMDRRIKLFRTLNHKSHNPHPITAVQIPNKIFQSSNPDLAPNQSHKPAEKVQKFVRACRRGEGGGDGGRSSNCASFCDKQGGFAMKPARHMVTRSRMPHSPRCSRKSPHTRSYCTLNPKPLLYSLVDSEIFAAKAPAAGEGGGGG